MIACHSLISLGAPFPAVVAMLALSNVPDGGSRSGVSLRGSSRASTFDLSGWPSLFLATSGSLPLVYFGIATRIMARYSGVVKLKRRASFPVMSIAW